MDNCVHRYTAAQTSPILDNRGSLLADAGLAFVRPGAYNKGKHICMEDY